MIFTGMSLKVLALLFGSSLIAFVISVFLNSRKVNISLLLNVFLIFLVEWFLKCLNKCFRDFFHSNRGLLTLRVFVKFVRYFRIIFDYYVIFVEGHCVTSFTFTREDRFYGHPEFLSVRKAYGI